MALLDKVRQFTSKFDRNPEKQGIQILPPVNLKQNVRNFLQTPVSVPKPVARLTTSLANITPGKIATQGLLQNKPLQAFAQAGLRTPIGIKSDPSVSGVKNFVAQYAKNRYIEPVRQIPYNTQQTFGRDKALVERGMGALGLLGGLATFVPDPIQDVAMPIYDFSKGARAAYLKTGKPSVQNLIAGTQAMSLEKPVGLGDAITTNPLGQTIGNIAEFPLLIAGGIKAGQKQLWTKRIMDNEKEIFTAVAKAKNYDKYVPEVQMKLLTQIDDLVGRIDKKTQKELSKDPEGFTKSIKFLEDAYWTAKDPKLNIGFNIKEKKTIPADSPKLSVELTGGKDLTAQARNQGGIGDINDVKSRLLNVFTFSESEKLAIRKAQTPEELAPYLRKLNDGSLAKFFNSGAGTVEHPNQPKPLSVEPTGGKDIGYQKSQEMLNRYGKAERPTDVGFITKNGDAINYDGFNKHEDMVKSLGYTGKNRLENYLNDTGDVRVSIPYSETQLNIEIRKPITQQQYNQIEKLSPGKKVFIDNYINNKSDPESSRDISYLKQFIESNPNPSPLGGKVEPVAQGGETLYHGSDNIFDEMQVGRPTKRRMMFNEYDTTTHGMFFTPDKKVAGEFGKNVGEYKVSVKNPLVFSDKKNDALFNEFDKLIANDSKIDIKPGEPGFQEFMYFDGELGKRFTDFVKKKGFDGAKIGETSEFTGNNFDTVVAFDNAQVKKISPSSVAQGGLSDITKSTEMPQLSKQLESIQPAPKALGDLGISTKPQPELQKAQTLRNLKQESVPLDNIISEARKQIGTTPEPKDKNVKQVMDDLYTQWVSRYNPIEEASRKAKKTLKTKGAELRPEFDPEYLVRRLTGAGGIADQRFKTELNPIIKEMESLNIPKSDMDVYLANKRIAGFGKAGRDIYGADPKKAQEVVAAIESKYGNIQGLAQKMYDYQNKGFQEMVDAGFISPEAAQTIKSQNPDYAPLYRVMDEMDEYLGLPTRKTMQGTQPISKLKGSTRQIESPVESIIGNTFKQRAAIEKNRVAQSIVGLQNIADMGFTKAAKASPETITVWNNGKKEYWNVGKDIAETAKGQNEEQMNLLLKVLQAPASLLRQGATGRNPEFLLPNIIRDQLDAGITSKYGYIPFVDFTSGLISMAKNDDVYKKWANSGAKIDLGEISGKKSIQELFNSKVEKKKLSTWLSQGLDVLGTLSEQPTRVGLFKKAYKKTGNELIAMMESRDATVDFARMGSKMKVANSIIPFLNVGVQGFDKLIRAVKNNPGRVALNAGIYGALPAIMTTLYNLNKDPEAYAEIPQYEKDSNFILVIGRNKNGTVDYLTFPKGNVIPTIANPIESFLAFTRNEDPEAFKQMLTQTLTSTLPVVGDGATAGEVATKTIGGLIPQGIKPLAENLLNKSFYKYDPKKEQSKEIVPYYMQNKPAYQQTYDFTPQMYQKIGAVFNASPLKVKNLMEGYLAGYTKIPSQIVEMMYKTSRGEEISPNEKTLMRRFIKQTYPNSGKEPEVKPEVPGLMERVTGKVGAAETAPVKEIKYKRASDNSSQTIKLSDLQKPTGTTLKDYLSSGNRESTIREIYKGYATGAIKEADMQSAFKTAGITVKEAEDMVIKELPLAQKSSLVYDRLVSPTSTTKDLDSMVESKLLTTNVITELTDSGKITEEQSKALKNYLKQKSGKVSKGKKPKKFKPTKFKPIKLKGAKKTYLKQKKLTLKDLLRK